MRTGRRPAAALLVLWCGLVAAGCSARGRASSAEPPPAAAEDAGVLSTTSRLAATFDAEPALTLWSAQFVWADTGEVLFEHHPDRRLLPASNMKLVTLAAAAQRLGWEHRFTTTLHSNAAPVDGVLHGPLHVTGTGDPTLGWPTDAALLPLREWARQLRQQGLVRVEGDLVGSSDRQGADRLGDSWSWDDLPFAYAAPYAALTFHENTVAVVVTPAREAGARAHVRLEPAESGLQLSANVETVAPGTRPAAVSIDRPLGSHVLTVTGAVAAGTHELVRYAAVPDPAAFFLNVLRRALAAEGIDVRGRTRIADAGETSITPDPAGVRVTHQSPPLADLAVRFMKTSQNLYGEALLHAIVAGPDATLAARRQAVTEALAALGVPADDLQVADGSGLSRRNFVSARALVGVLRAMNEPTHREAYRRTLPIAGVDGTLERRLVGSACAGRVRAKTGTLSHARALSGYLLTPAGREIVFSVLANNHLRPTVDVDARVEAALLPLCQ